MIFNSFVFVLFFVLVYAGYLLLGKRHTLQNRLLLVASYLFYGYWDWRFLSLILISTTIDYYCGLGIARDEANRKRYLVTSVAVNLGLLGVFKYLGFFSDSAVRLLNAVGMEADPLTLNIILPVGISFYTFQTLSYTIDIYRGKLEPCHKFLDFALYVAFFPQLVAGPIERAVRFLPQITTRRTVTWEGVQEGAWLVAWGYYKKVFVADNVAAVVETVFSAPAASGSEVLIGAYAFAIQVYGDFSGYSDIARGLAKMMGFDLVLNFDLPYFAKNPSEFWQRWHISLSTWIRDYVYISLGGSRQGTFITLRNLFLTMFLGGLWHGAAWTFAIWGTFHGVLLIGYALAPPIPWPRGSVWGLAKKILAALLFFNLHCYSLLIFRAQSMGQVKDMTIALFTDPIFSLGDLGLWKALVGFTALLALVQVIQLLKKDLLFMLKLPRPALGMAYGIILYFVLMHGAVSDSFIYFQF